MFKFDPYTAQARLAPILVSIQPLAFMMVCVFPDNAIGWGFLSAILSSFGIMVLLAQSGRDQGKRVQEKLYEKWGASPAVLMLSQTRSTMNQQTLTRRQEAILQIYPDVSLPDKALEEENWILAVEQMDDVISKLIHLTRRPDFYMVKNEVLNYGVRRNFLGLKSFALWVIVFSLVMLFSFEELRLAETCRESWSCVFYGMRPIVKVSFILNAVLGFLWLTVITKSWVRIAGDAYATQLLGAVEQLHQEFKGKT